MRFIKQSLNRRFLFYVLLGYLPVGFALYFLADLVKGNAYTLLVAVLIVLPLAFALFFWRSFLSPLEVILNEERALLAGSEYKKIFTNRIDEIGVLAYFFNQVTKGLGQASTEIKDRERMLDELSVAAQLQRDILPLEAPKVPGLQIVAKNKPATELGGDSFDFIANGAKTYFYVGDVTGHGVAAGLVMTMVNSLIKVFVENGLSAYDVVVRVNKYIKKHVKKAMFMTFVMLCWDNEEKKFTFVGAGHEHILVYRPATGECEAIMSGGVALGMVPDNSKLVKEVEIPTSSGDFIILYSDGIVEAKNPAGELFGLDRLRTLVLEYAPRYGAEGINYHIAKDVSAFNGTHLQDDDMTLIVIQRDDSLAAGGGVNDLSTNWNE